MKLIQHRCNTVDQLLSTKKKYGVEVDIRSKGELLIIHHDPFKNGELFEKWLENFDHGTLILNVKEEGLEEKLISIMRSNGITDYFFLDQSFPFLVKWARFGEYRCAVRFSEYESIETVLNLSKMVNWVWVDCFTKFILNKEDSKKLISRGFKICLVSPELQALTREKEIYEIAPLLKKKEISVEAICTKFPETWEKLLFSK